MGYTHYWYRPAVLPVKAFAGWAADVAQLALGLPTSTHSAGGYYEEAPLRLADGGEAPCFTRELVYFNGGGEMDGVQLGHETFWVKRTIPADEQHRVEGGRCFEFCKTERKPYDLLVTAALVAMAKYFGTGVSIDSDGTPDEWAEGIKFCRVILGYGAFPCTKEWALTTTGRRA